MAIPLGTIGTCVPALYNRSVRTKSLKAWYREDGRQPPHERAQALQRVAFIAEAGLPRQSLPLAANSRLQPDFLQLLAVILVKLLPALGEILRIVERLQSLLAERLAVGSRGVSIDGQPAVDVGQGIAPGGRE